MARRRLRPLCFLHLASGATTSAPVATLSLVCLQLACASVWVICSSSLLVPAPACEIDIESVEMRSLASGPSAGGLASEDVARSGDAGREPPSM